MKMQEEGIMQTIDLFGKTIVTFSASGANYNKQEDASGTDAGITR